jgi:hypothetical protein
LALQISTPAALIWLIENFNLSLQPDLLGEVSPPQQPSPPPSPPSKGTMTKNFREDLTQSDLAVSSLAFGFTIGFGLLTTWEAIKQTTRARNPFKSLYIWMVWGEIFVCMTIALVVWLSLYGFYEVR